jgi:hypothetical protein
MSYICNHNFNVPKDGVICPKCYKESITDLECINNIPKPDDAEIFKGIMGLMFDIEVIISDTSPRNTITIDRRSYEILKRRYKEKNDEKR